MAKSKKKFLAWVVEAGGRLHWQDLLLPFLMHIDSAKFTGSKAKFFANLWSPPCQTAVMGTKPFRRA